MTFYLSMAEAYPSLLSLVMDKGRMISPRGQTTQELIGHSFTLIDPTRSIVTHKIRKINPSFMAAEFLWMLFGLNDAAIIGAFNSQILGFSDEGIWMRGAYGPKIVEQLPYIVQTLRNDPDSRQALLTLWRERPGPSKDIPCTISMQFFIRSGKLEMLVYMRSNDLWLGLPYDVFSFTMLQQFLASALDVEPGPYHHHVGSLHLYERNFEIAGKMICEPPFSPSIQTPKIQWPTPPAMLAYLAAFAGWGNQPLNTAEVVSWLQSSGVLDNPTGWDELIQLCAYKFHKDPGFLPPAWQGVITYWRQA